MSDFRHASLPLSDLENLPWDAAALGDLDFSEQLLVFGEEEPDKAAVEATQLAAERRRLEREEYVKHSLLDDLPETSQAGTSSCGRKRGLELAEQAGGGASSSSAPRGAGSAKDEGALDAAASKACREKARRTRLNDRFAELAKLLVEPGESPKTDKATIIVTAISAVKNLRREIGQLRQLNKYLEERVAQYEKQSGLQMYQQVIAYTHGQQQAGNPHAIPMPGPGEPQQPSPCAGMHPPPSVLPQGAVPVYHVLHPSAAGHAPMQGMPAMHGVAGYAPAGVGGSSEPKAPSSSVPSMSPYGYFPPSTIDMSNDATLRPPVA